MLAIIFLSIFMLSSTVIIKDSYDKYDLKLSEKIFGNWDVHYTKQKEDLDDEYSKYDEEIDYDEYDEYYDKD